MDLMLRTSCKDFSLFNGAPMQGPIATTRHKYKGLLIQLALVEHLVGVEAMFARDASHRGSWLQRQFYQGSLEFRGVLAVLATCTRAQ